MRLCPQVVEDEERRDAQLVVKVDSKSAKGRKTSKKQMMNDDSKPDPGGRDIEFVIPEAVRKTTAAAAKKRKLVEVRVYFVVLRGVTYHLTLPPPPYYYWIL